MATTVEKIKTQYMLYELRAIPKDKFELIKILNVFIDDMEETIASSKLAMRDNVHDEYLTKIKNFFYGLFGYEEENVEQFSQDTGVVLRHNCLAERYMDYFRRMKVCLNDDNYIDLCKLTMFTYESYTSNYAHLQMLRESIRYNNLGINYYGREEDTQSEFAEFFEETFLEMLEDKKTLRNRRVLYGKKSANGKNTIRV